MAEATYEVRLPCGGKLKVSKNNWEIYYYFPGPDRRYNGTHVTIPGADIERYINAFEENFLDYEKLKQSVPAGGEFSKNAKMGMSIRIGKLWEGVCIKSYHMPVSTRARLNEILDGYRGATSKVAELQKTLFDANIDTSKTSTLTAQSFLVLNPKMRYEPPKSTSTELSGAKERVDIFLDKNSPFDPYAPQHHMRGRKSHLAAAINKNIHDHPTMGTVWVIVFVLLIFGSFILAILK